MRRSREAGAQPKVPAGELGTVLSSRNERITPALLHWLYRTSGYVPTAARYNMVGIVGLLNDYPNPDDLRLFMNEYRDDATSATYTVALVSCGGYDPSNPDIELNTGIQYVQAMAFSATHIYSTALVLPGAIRSSIGSTSCSVG